MSFKRVLFIFFNLIISTLYILVYFFCIAFMYTSKYGEGGFGGKLDSEIGSLIFCLIFLAIIVVMIIVTVKVKPEKILTSICIELIILKWSSLIFLILGIYGSWYFYHTAGFLGYLGMIIWDLILFAIYKILKWLSDMVIERVDEWKSNEKWNNLRKRLKKS